MSSTNTQFSNNNKYEVVKSSNMSWDVIIPLLMPYYKGSNIGLEEFEAMRI